jgi:hypothetical protein
MLFSACFKLFSLDVISSALLKRHSRYSLLHRSPLTTDHTDLMASPCPHTLRNPDSPSLLSELQSTLRHQDISLTGLYATTDRVDMIEMDV